MNPLSLKVNVHKLKKKNTAKLLGITIDTKLHFEEHISELCKKASMLLNAISHLQRFIGKEQKGALINSFIFSNFNYCPLV